MKNLCLLAFLLISRTTLATHLLGGYIQVNQSKTSAQQYSFSVIVFMDEINGKIAAEQTPTLTLCFGDGTSGVAQRTERALLPGNPYISRNLYTINHTYAGPGTYTALCQIANRTDGVANIPSSLGVPFGLSTTFSTNLPNNTPAVSLVKSDTAYVYQKAILQFQSTDAEGDSLIYLLAKPKTASTSPCVPQLSDIASFVFPNSIGQRGTFKIDSKSGQLTWDAPTATGRYDIAVTVQEWRKGVLLSQTLVDHLILIIDKANNVPGTIPPYEPAQVSADGIVTGVMPTESNQDALLTVFPVPALDQLKVTLDLKKPSSITLQLIDLTGRIVHETQQKTPTERYERTIDVHALASGVYFIQTQADNQTVTKKVFIH